MYVSTVYVHARACVCMYVHVFEGYLCKIFYVYDVYECMYTYIHIKVCVHMMYTLMYVNDHNQNS
jgi:hypothetical protein